MIQTKPKVLIVGSGQLARMLSWAALPLGVEVRTLRTSTESPANYYPGRITEIKNFSALTAEAREWLAWADVITFESENIDTSFLADFQDKCFPPLQAIKTCQSRISEKRLFESLGIPTTRWHAIQSESDLLPASQLLLDQDCFLKLDSQGYDGRGQITIKKSKPDMALLNLKKAWSDFAKERPCILEGQILLKRELSSLMVVSKSDSCFYPLNENHHEEGILRTSSAPAFSDHADEILKFTQRLAQALNYIGVFCVEWFESIDGQILANEMAPRVHNSGHGTLSRAYPCSQFENHIRAVCDLPLGSTALDNDQKVIMTNILGVMPAIKDRSPHASYFDYCKEPRALRKLGHFTEIHRKKFNKAE